MKVTRFEADPNALRSGWGHFPGPEWDHDAKWVAELAGRFSGRERPRPIIMSSDDMIVDGHHRVAAARAAGLASVDCIRLAMTWKETADLRKAEMHLKRAHRQHGLRLHGVVQRWAERMSGP